MMLLLLLLDKSLLVLVQLLRKGEGEEGGGRGTDL